MQHNKKNTITTKKANSRMRFGRVETAALAQRISSDWQGEGGRKKNKAEEGPARRAANRKEPARSRWTNIWKR